MRALGQTLTAKVAKQVGQCSWLLPRERPYADVVPLDPNFPGKDDHRLAPDVNVIIVDLNIHEARTAGALE